MSKSAGGTVTLYKQCGGADKAVLLMKLVVLLLTEQRLELPIISVIFSVCCTGLHTHISLHHSSKIGVKMN